MTRDPLKIKLKASLWSLFLAISIIICFLGESFISYEKKKKEDFKEAEAVIFYKISEFEKLIDSDLDRIWSFESFEPDKKNLIKLYENSGFNFFIKSNPHTYSLYTGLLVGKERRIYSKYGLIQEEFIPKEIIERCYFEIEKFKIFYKNDTLYFAKGYFYDENTPCILFISQDIKEFISHADLKHIELTLNTKTGAFMTSSEDLLNHIHLEYTCSWGIFFLYNRMGLLLCCLLFVIIGLSAFMLNVLRLTHIIGEKHKAQYEDLSRKILASQGMFDKIQQENLMFQKKYSAQKLSSEGRENIFKKIFPLSREFSKALQPMQQVFIMKWRDQKIEEALGKFSENLKKIECPSRMVKLSLSKTVQEVILSFSEELTENNIRISIKGRDFLIYGELSILYYVIYFVLKNCITRVPPNGLITLKLETRLNISKLVIEDNGFILSENHLKQLDTISSPCEKRFLIDPTQEDLIKSARSLGWEIVGGDKKGVFNVTEIIITGSSEREAKIYSGFNIINLFKSK